MPFKSIGVNGVFDNVLTRQCLTKKGVAISLHVTAVILPGNIEHN